MATASVSARARLHLGFFDPAGTRGRRFGGLGLALEEIRTTVTVRLTAAAKPVFSGEINDTVRELARLTTAHYQLPPGYELEVTEQIPRHAGLGSGTQLALAIGTALTRANGLDVGSTALAEVLQRGRRSGAGIGLFGCGGLVADGGHGVDTVQPPIISRLPCPAAWRVVLLSDRGAAGLNGGEEVAAFKQLPPLPQDLAATLCHLTLMGVLPAVAEADFGQFSTAIGAIQAIVGDHFAAAQNGRFTSAAAGAAARYCEEHLGYNGIGQSSWGPTAFVFVPDDEAASQTVEVLAKTFATSPDLVVRICRPSNDGAVIAVEPS